LRPLSNGFAKRRKQRGRVHWVSAQVFSSQSSVVSGGEEGARTGSNQENVNYSALAQPARTGHPQVETRCKNKRLSHPPEHFGHHLSGIPASICDGLPPSVRFGDVEADRRCVFVRPGRVVAHPVKPFGTHNSCYVRFRHADSFILFWVSLSQHLRAGLNCGAPRGLRNKGEEGREKQVPRDAGPAESSRSR
jgi:hypothetical protein